MTPGRAETHRPRRRRRGRAVAAVGVAVTVGAAAWATAGFGFGLGPGAAPAASVGAGLPPETAPVTRQTLQDTDEVAGALGYGGTTMLAGRVPGVVTALPLAGAVLGRGQPIYRVDDVPVVLLSGAVAAYRPLGPGAVGTDVRQLETNLAALGYRGFTVDRRYTASTAVAVRRWQRALGLPRTGRIEQGRVVFAPGRIRVDSVTASVNQSTGGADEILRYTGTDRVVTVQLDVSRQRLARTGAAVRIRMPDGKLVAGRVGRVYTVIAPPADPGGQSETRIEAVVALADPGAATGISAAVVDVVFTAADRPDVLTVPVAALVALAEGGYGVEVVEGSSTRYVAVTTGLFANGRVEISGAGLREGMTVGMPR
ncbi:MAG TPA: peptidoglycan-binding domain-containing protein [Asanoa sp.]|jgi:peptidoglycan hydrolase-like protein with peptidoglycan-binding domain|nr:peptidoglycan-binding domain-containing protein [Asanoa sp.]